MNSTENLESIQFHCSDCQKPIPIGEANVVDGRVICPKCVRKFETKHHGVKVPAGVWR